MSIFSYSVSLCLLWLYHHNVSFGNVPVFLNHLYFKVFDLIFFGFIRLPS
jgi:hypothetical protein